MLAVILFSTVRNAAQNRHAQNVRMRASYSMRTVVTAFVIPQIDYTCNLMRRLVYAHARKDITCIRLMGA